MGRGLMARTAVARRGGPRRVLAVTLFLGGLLTTLVPTLARAQDPRVETSLIGYDNEAYAQGLAVRFFEPFIPIPVDPGDPQFELTLAHSGATLTTGPLSRGVASSIWPGGGVGDGFGAVICSQQGGDCDDSQTYPVRASAEYPGGGPQSWSQATELAPGFGMTASALGLDAQGRAVHGPPSSPLDALVHVSSVLSESTVTEEDGVTVSRGIATVEGVEIAAGLVSIDSVTTTIEARSDGNSSVTSGDTVVAGMTIAGQPARLTDEGIEILTTEGEDGPTGPLSPLTDPLFDVVSGLLEIFTGPTIEEAIGIELLLPAHVETIDGGIGERRADGLTLVLDTDVLNSVIVTVLNAFEYQDVLDQVFSNLPPDVAILQGYLVELANFAPRTEIVLGRGFVAASAVPAFEFEAPPLPDLPPVTIPPLDTGSGVSTTSPGGGNTFTSPPAISSPPTSSGPGSPSVAPPGGGVPVASGSPLERDSGIPLVLLGVALMLAAVPSYGLTSLREAAVGANATTAVGGDVPDLRKV